MVCIRIRLRRVIVWSEDLEGHEGLRMDGFQRSKGRNRLARSVDRPGGKGDGGLGLGA